MKKDKNRSKLGFTLAEVLMVVAIMVILFALAVPAVASFQKSLKQKELDSKAESIYTAVQNKLSELYTSGNAYKYNPTTYKDTSNNANYIHKLDDDPGDLDDVNWGKFDHVYYFVSGGDVDKEILGDDTIADDLKNGYYVIEIIPYAINGDEEATNQITAGTVYAVWYSEGDLKVNETYDGSSSSNYNTNYRVKQNRKALINGNTGLGYYGGTYGEGSKTNALSISKLLITSNEEVNTAYVTINKPISVTDKVVMTFTLSDAYGKKVVIGYDTTSNTLTYNGNSLPDRAKRYFSVSKSGVNYIFTFTLDDLKTSSSRFASIFGDDLTVGSNIKLEVNAKAVIGELPNALVSPANGEAYGNSLYAYVYDGEKEESGFKQTNEVYISTGRHLQNLDSDSSKSDSKFTKATLISDISFKEDSEFYEEYNSTYFNGKTKITKITSSGTINTVSVSKFKGINNPYLDYLGSKCTNEDGTSRSCIIKNLSSEGNNAGLFSNVSNTLTIANLNLIGTTIQSNNNAGGLVGQVTDSGEVVINNVKLYLDTTNGDIPSSISTENDNNLEAVKWIVGNNSGGLVGYNAGNLTIKESFASTVLGKANHTAGGLVGTNAGTLNINKSYADSYLYGLNVGGLVGNTSGGNVSLTSSYASGYIGLDNDDNASGAGLVNGTINSVSNAYTVISPYNVSSEGGISNALSTGKYYATAKVVNSGTSTLHYLKSSNVENGDKGIGSVSKSTFSTDTNFTTDSTLSTVPYKLMGQSLSSYPYPKIVGLGHYGDWDSDFTPGALVYYEIYKDSKGNLTYGFEGANIKSSLSSANSIVGDGYGVVFKQGEVATSFKYNGTTYTTSSMNPYQVTVNGFVYYVYPLDKTTVNPTSVSSYYTRATIESYYGTSSNPEVRYFDYNPHFASSVVEVNESGSATSANPNIVSIRSPRQLYNLSTYYISYRGLLGSSITYRQGRNIDYAIYDWTNYYGSTISSQAPIGKDLTNSFIGTFDGYYNEINNVSFVSNDSSYVGLFGFIAKGSTVENVILAVNYTSSSSTTYYVNRSDSNSASTLYIGVLAGYNNGTITNSAVAGYYLSGTNGTIKGKLNDIFYIGGLVGYNDSNGKISNSTSDLPIIELDMYRSTSFTGGFVGYNNGGNISNCYDLTYIYGNGQNGKTYIAGFAAYNSGTISNSYCATSLKTAGTGSVAYAFAPNSGGTFTSDNYLNSGTYEFTGVLYSYNAETSSSAGYYKTYKELTNSVTNSQKAASSKYHSLTKEDTYPYKAVVKDSNGKLVHYGDWQLSPTMGSYGIFYWEYESGGNEGYHISFVGMDNGTPIYNSTLCEEHDDGGIITSYGYGYFHSDNTSITNISLDGISYSGSEENETANKALHEQFPNLTFHSYTTSTDTNENSNYIYLSNSDINGSITLTSKFNDKVTTNKFYVSPFFGDAYALYMSSSDLNTLESKITLSDDLLAHISTNSSYGRSVLSSDEKTPGSKSNSYEIRSIIQLQYLNWNSNEGNYSSLVTKNESNYKYYNYLMSTYTLEAGTQTASNAGYSDNQYLYFEVTHDLNAKDSNGKYLLSNFTPIAGQKTSSGSVSYDAVLAAWFGSHFYGNSYKIQELHINSSSFTVGIFGVTAGAEIKDVIMYSKNGAIIKRSTTDDDGDNPNYFSTDGGYSIGGLIGVAYGYNGSQTLDSNAIRNCAISGYKIIDQSYNKQTMGEANVGGLIGASNVNIEQCSAIVDIEINCKHNNNGTFTYAQYGNFVRVGGISGAVQYKITNCYTGGKITVDDDVLEETYNSNNPNYINGRVTTGSAKINRSTNIYIAGIAGSGFTMTYKNFRNSINIVDGSPDVENSYTYITFPKYEGTIRSIAMITSVADRYTWASTCNIINCYYLASSADIDVSNAPKYYFNGNSNSAYNLLVNSGSNYYKNNMLIGDTYLLGQMFGLENRTLYHPIKDELTPVSYKQLTGESTVSNNKYLTTLLNEYNTSAGINITWNEVSTESGSPGKYSFPSGDKSLEGRDYPFPSVVRQDDYYVHYGVWPMPSAYFEEALVSMNIFDYINDNGDSIYEIALDLNGQSSNKMSIPSFKVDPDNTTDPDILEIVDGPTLNDEKTKYIVKVKALYTGTTSIKATWTVDDVSYSDTQTFNITADLEAYADPSSMTLGNGKQATSTLYACSLDKLTIDEQGNVSCGDGRNYSTSVKWEATSSNIGTSTEKAAQTSIASNKLTITGTGNDASIQIKATYTYNGVDYYAYTAASVSRLGGVGLYAEGALKLQEAEVITDTSTTTTDINGEDRTYYGGTGPSYTQDFYLYQTYSDILNKALNNCVATSCPIEVVAKEVNGTVETDASGFTYTLDTSVSSLDGNNFSYLGLNVVYRPQDHDSSKTIKLYVTVIDQDTNIKYHFTAETKIEFTPYNLTLNYNYTGSTSTVVKATEDLNLDEYEPTRTGYTFEGWFTDSDCTNAFTYDYSSINDDTTIYAKWTPITKTITLTNDEGTIKQEGLIATYDKGFETEPTINDFIIEGKTLLGFVDANEKYVITVNDNKVAYSIDDVNALILSNFYTLYARYSSKTTLTLYTYTDSDYSTTYKVGDYSIDKDSSTSNINIKFNNYDSSTYTITGWFTSDGKQVLSAVGKVVYNVEGYTKNGVIDTDYSTISLYAHWAKTTSEIINGYILADKFEAGETYVIINTNSGTGYALGIADENGLISNKPIVVSKDEDTNVIYINPIVQDKRVDVSLYEWKITNGDNSRFRMYNNDKYLGYDSGRIATGNLTSESSKNWYYSNSDHSLSTRYRSIFMHTAYLSFNGSTGYNFSSDNYYTFYIYKKGTITKSNTEELDYFDGTLTQSDDIEIELETYSNDLPIEDVIDDETVVDEVVNVEVNDDVSDTTTPTDTTVPSFTEPIEDTSDVEENVEEESTTE